MLRSSQFIVTMLKGVGDVVCKAWAGLNFNMVMFTLRKCKKKGGRSGSRVLRGGETMEAPGEAEAVGEDQEPVY